MLNAANEEAVAAFLGGTIAFDAIHKINAATLDALVPDAGRSGSVGGLLDLDREARLIACRFIRSLAS